MNEVEIPIRLSGIGAVKSELKNIKNQLIDATDPAEIDRLTTRAGELNQNLRRQIRVLRTSVQDLLFNK